MVEACVAGCGECGTGSGERNCQGKRLRGKVEEEKWKKEIKVYCVNVKKNRNCKQIGHLDEKSQAGNQ